MQRCRNQTADFYIKKGEVNDLRDCWDLAEANVVRAIFGADRVIGGTVKKNGKQVKIIKPLDAMRCGIGYLPEDRKRDGIVGDLSVRENYPGITGTSWILPPPISKAKLINLQTNTSNC